MERFVLLALGLATFACTPFAATGDPPSDAGGASEAGIPPPDAATPPSKYSLEVLADAPLAYFRLGDSARGSTVASSVGTMTGVVPGGTTGVPGLLAGDADGAVSLNGTGAILLGSVFDFTGTSPFTLEAWLRADVLDTEYRLVFEKVARPAGIAEAYGVFVRSTSVTFERYVSGTQVGVSWPGITAGAIFHVVASYDGATLRLFVNGALTAATGDGRPSPAKDAPFLVGGGQGANENFRGTLDEVAVYDKALSALRVAVHYSAGIPPP